MLKKILLATVFFLLCAPLLSSVQEFGHAFVPAVKDQPVEVRVGALDAELFRARVGGIDWIYGSPLRPWLSATVVRAPATEDGEAAPIRDGGLRSSARDDDSYAALLLGPIVSVLAAITLGFLIWIIPNATIPLYPLWVSCVVWLFGQAVVSMLPLEYPTEFGYAKHTYSTGKRVLAKLQADTRNGAEEIQALQTAATEKFRRIRPGRR